MTPEQKQLVRDSWARILPIREQAAELFYGRLFDRYPEVRPYFAGDMEAQGRKLMTMLDTAVEALDRFDTQTGPLAALGRRHSDYGVKKEDYDKVADAFLWALEQGLGPGFTPEVKAAWVVTYSAVADAMLNGTAEVAAD